MRGFVLWLLGCVALAMKEIEAIARQVQEQVKEREHQIVYKQFEAAIAGWEKRTGKQVERTFRELEEGEFFGGADWRNFAMFLGSREATKWRTKYGYELKDAVEEWKALKVPEPEMTIEGEEK